MMDAMTQLMIDNRDRRIEQQSARLVQYQLSQARLAAALRDAVRYIEVQNAYRGAMTAAQVEDEIKRLDNVSEVAIGANLARFKLAEARALLAAAGV